MAAIWVVFGHSARDPRLAYPSARSLYHCLPIGIITLIITNNNNQTCINYTRRMNLVFKGFKGTYQDLLHVLVFFYKA